MKARILATLGNLLLVVIGLALVGYGVWLVHQPSAYIVVGAALLIAGLPSTTNSTKALPK